MNMTIRLILWVSALAVGLAACQPAPTAALPPTPTRAGVFETVRSATSTPTHIRPSITPPTATPFPTPTITPRTHVVKAGEDMAGIALRYRVALADLRAANPDVNPRLMKIGTILIIPASAEGPTAEAKATATPQTIVLEPPVCYPDAAGGVWCFCLVRNRGTNPAAHVSATLRLFNPDGKQVAQQTVWLGLDLLPPGQAMPVSAHFTGLLPGDFQAAAQLSSALPATSVENSYPLLTITSQAQSILPDGLEAEISGIASLAGGQTGQAQLALLAVAFGENGAVVGVRRWESDKILMPGQPLNYRFTIYSSGKKINRIEVYAEARK